MLQVLQYIFIFWDRQSIDSYISTGFTRSYVGMNDKHECNLSQYIAIEESKQGHNDAYGINV